MTLYMLSLACAVAYAATIALGDSWPLLGIAAFALTIVAVIRDRDISANGQRRGRLPRAPQ